MVKQRGRVIGLDVHPDSFAGAILEGIAKSYEGQIREANGSQFGPSITFASSRKILSKD